MAPSGTSFVTLPGSAWTGELLVATLKGTSPRRLRVKGSKVQGEEMVIAGEYGRLRAVTEAPLRLGDDEQPLRPRRSRGRRHRLLRVVSPAG